MATSAGSPPSPTFAPKWVGRDDLPGFPEGFVHRSLDENSLLRLALAEHPIFALEIGPRCVCGRRACKTTP